MSEIKVNSIKGVGATNAAITVNNSDGTCTANITNNLSNRNLIINGAMKVAQRGTSSTDSGIHTVDRFQYFGAGTDELPTQSQADVAAGTTPYSLGFRKCFKITNGNQTSGAGAADYVWFRYVVEDQDIATSGWNYTSASSFITLSFWVKSSVSQVFNGVIRSLNGTSQMYPISLGSLTANTWTKITKTIPGNSNITFNNNNSAGLAINIFPFFGTDYTDNSTTENAWAVNNGSARAKDSVTTWYTTNDATFEVTGFQLEVGSVATDFEHRSFAEELELCKRYYQQSYPYGTYPSAVSASGSETVNIDDGAIQRTMIRLHKTMRASSATTVIYNPATGASNSVRSNSGANFTPGGIYDVGNNSFFTDYTPNSGEFVQFHWTIDMEL